MGKGIQRRKTGEGNLITAAICFAIAALLLFAAGFQSNWPLWFRLAVGVIGLTVAILGVLIGSAGVELLQIRHEENQAHIATVWERAQPDVVKIESYTALVSRLSMAGEDTLRVLAAFPELARIIVSNFGPFAAVTTKDGEVPYSFVDEWWAANKDKDVLVSVNQWPTTAGKRQYASWLERHLISLRLLVTWGGRRTAQWASPGAKTDFLKTFYGERINQQYRPENAFTDEAENDL